MADTQPSLPRVLAQVRAMETAFADCADELSAQVVEGRSEDGNVRIKLTGAYAVKRVRINPDAADADNPKTLEKAVVAALADALDQVRALAAEKTSQVAGSLAT